MPEIYYYQRATRHVKENMLLASDVFEIHRNYLYGKNKSRKNYFTMKSMKLFGSALL